MLSSGAQTNLIRDENVANEKVAIALSTIVSTQIDRSVE